MNEEQPEEELCGTLVERQQRRSCELWGMGAVQFPGRCVNMMKSADSAQTMWKCPLRKCPQLQPSNICDATELTPQSSPPRHLAYVFR